MRGMLIFCIALPSPGFPSPGLPLPDSPLTWLSPYLGYANYPPEAKHAAPRLRNLGFNTFFCVPILSGEGDNIPFISFCI